MRNPDWTRLVAGAAWAATALGFLLLARGLPAETFFVGDPGVKLIAARDARADQPLEIPLPRIGVLPVPYVEPFFKVHGDHSHALTSEAFPLATSPLIALFGIRGAYLLPALGFFLTLAASIRLAETFGIAKPSVAGLTMALGTPLLFYGLEFWEHVPAVGVAAVATPWLVGAGHADNPRGAAFVAGLLFGLAILLRPEAVWFLIAVAAASRFLTSPIPWNTLAIAAAGIAAALLPLTAYSLLHFGTIVPPHVESQSHLLSGGWLAMRGAVLSRWFGAAAIASGDFWGLALLAGLALGWLATRPSPVRSFLVTAALVDIVLVVLTAPNDGGGQWGPRYLLFAFVPAALLAAGALETALQRRPVGIALVVVALTAGIWIQRVGYRELRGAKRTYSRVLDFVRREVPSGGNAVTDLWWLDQVAAAATADRRILYSPDVEAVRDILRRLTEVGVDAVTLFYSRDESPLGGSWLADGCFREVGRSEVPERTLVAVRLQRCP
jgi:hypothetical protein